MLALVRWRAARCGAAGARSHRSRRSSGPPPALKLPPIQKRTLSNGLPVWIVELHKVPVVQVNLVVRSRHGDDPAGKFGVASLTAGDARRRRRHARSALEIADAVDFLGADSRRRSDVDASAVRLHVPVARLADALPIMADVALRPTFPDDELEARCARSGSRRCSGARRPASSSIQVAFPRLVYGTQHRYGTASIGTAATLKAFTADDLRAFHAAHYRPTNAALIVVGDVTADTVDAAAREALRRVEGAAAGAGRPRAGGAAADGAADLS